MGWGGVGGWIFPESMDGGGGGCLPGICWVGGGKPLCCGRKALFFRRLVCHLSQRLLNNASACSYWGAWVEEMKGGRGVGPVEPKREKRVTGEGWGQG